jgi:hypothetical protein
MVSERKQMEREWQRNGVRNPLHRTRWCVDWNGKLSHAQGSLSTLPCDYELVEPDDYGD